MRFSEFVRAAAFAVLIFAILMPGFTGGQEPAFVEYLRNRAGKGTRQRGHNDPSLSRFCPIDSEPLARRALFDYGSIFAATDDVRLPSSCIFDSSDDVAAFQSELKVRRATFGSVEIELQDKAMHRLLKAVEEASRAKLSITPLDGSIAGRRSFEDTIRIWNSRFHRALNFWVRQGRISATEADLVRTSSVREQANRVIRWESAGAYFSTDLSKSIFYSVAPPGTSQHLSLLAFDVVESGNPLVRQILNKHGWFQTIRTDQPHFTFLGLDESELPKRGLRKEAHQGNFYWVPDDRFAARPSAGGR